VTPLLTLDGVSKTYRRGLYEFNVLVDASLEVHAGAFVAVFGERSAGKTTLLKIAAGLETPDSGLVNFDGRDLSTISSTSLASVHRDDLAWVDRTGPSSDELTMVDYIGLPLLRSHGHGGARRRAIEALKRVGLKECVSARWGDLSDAERAHVSIAHALVRGPRLLVLDDPTAGLDIIERERVLGLLRATADENDAGVLMAVPDVPAMLRADEVLSLAGGRLVGPAEQETGEHAVVLEFPQRQRSL
jgi:ABC-type lipoprotein export system ATPase subunit